MLNKQPCENNNPLAILQIKVKESIDANEFFFLVILNDKKKIFTKLQRAIVLFFYVMEMSMMLVYLCLCVFCHWPRGKKKSIIFRVKKNFSLQENQITEAVDNKRKRKSCISLLNILMKVIARVPLRQYYAFTDQWWFSCIYIYMISFVPWI